MQPRHVILALLVVVLWGGNFVAIKVALADLAPLNLCALRFILTALAALVIPLPQIPKPYLWRYLWSYGFFMFILQFVLLFIAMKEGISAGLASLVLQAQLVFSLVFGVVFLKERPVFGQVLGAVLAVLGFLLIAKHHGSELSWWGFGLVLGAAASWSLGNLTVKRMAHLEKMNQPPINMMAVVAWSSVLVAPVLTALAFVFQGAPRMPHLFGPQLSINFYVAITYIVVASTWIGYGGWNYLMARYPMTTIAPFALLVPVVGLLSSSWWLGESLPSWKLIACLFVVLGLLVHVIASRRLKSRDRH